MDWRPDQCSGQHVEVPAATPEVPPHLAAVWRQADDLRAHGDVPAAIAALEPAAEVASMAYGTDSPAALITLHRLAVLYRLEGDLAAARRVLDEAQAGGELRFGDDDPLMLAIAGELGAVAEELGNRHEARRNWGKVAQYGPDRLGPDHPQVRAAVAYLRDDPAGPVYVPPERPALTGSTSQLPIVAPEPDVPPLAQRPPIPPPPAGSGGHPTPGFPALPAHPAPLPPISPPPFSPPPFSPPAQPGRLHQPDPTRRPDSPGEPDSTRQLGSAGEAGSAGQAGYAFPAGRNQAPSHQAGHDGDPTYPPGLANLAGHSHSGHSHPGQSQPGPSQPGQSHPGQSHPGQGQPGQGHPGQNQPGNTNRVGYANQPPLGGRANRPPGGHANLSPPGGYANQAAPGGYAAQPVEQGVWRVTNPQAGHEPSGEVHAAPRRRRGALLTVLIVLLVAGGLGAGGALWLRRGAGSPGVGPSATASADPGTVTGPAHKPPADVKLRDSGDHATLTWTDPTGGTVPFLISVGRSGQHQLPYATVAAGTTSYPINGLNVNYDYCFVVIAVYSANDLVTSELVCTRRHLSPSATPGG